MEPIEDTIDKTIRRRVLARRLLMGLAFLALVLPFFFMKIPAQAHLELPNGKSYSLEIAKTEEARLKGLGGRASLADCCGMLFVFDKPGRHCFWMKDVPFALDMIWLDESKKVVHIEEDVRPETYPDQFCNQGSAKYVVELNSGESGKNQLQVGQVVKL